jgi:serine protease Do
MISRRGLIKGLAACGLLPGAALRAQVRVITTHIALEDGRVWIAAKIGDSRPLLFIIDTGGVVSLIHDSVARELGLRARGSTRLVGVGGIQSFLLYEGRDVAFSSGAVQHSVVFGAAPHDLALGRDAAGAFSAGLFTESDSDLDFSRGEWRLYPDGRGAREGYLELPSSIQHVSGNETGSAYVFVDAVLDGNNYRFLVDTGMSGQLKLWPPATRRSEMWNDGRPFSPGRGQGIGGQGARIRMVRAGSLRLGGIVLERALVSLTDPSSSEGSHGDCDGIIGLGLLERLNLSTDVRRRRLWAQPSGRPPSEERYRLGGLWVDERHGALAVTELSPRSPAADAGLQLDDEIVGLSMAEFVHRADGRAGDSFELRYRRGGETRTTRLTLREFL